MADLLIKGMEIPKACGVCPVHYNEQLKMATDASRLKGKSRPVMRIFHVCPILRRDVTEYADNGEVFPDCPLVEVKPHGELKDFNDILTVFDKVIHDVDDKTNALLCDLLVQIQYAPTVLEASNVF